MNRCGITSKGSIGAGDFTSEQKRDERISFPSNNDVKNDALRGTTCLDSGRGRGKNAQFPARFVGGYALRSAVCLITAVLPALARAQQVPPAVVARALYQQANVPIERRVEDLLNRMTLEEKARQLDRSEEHTS